MNTYKKGIEFEKKVFQKFETLLEEDKLHVNTKQSKILFKPEYHSEARKEKIIFDISIETTQFESNEISLITIIECKNYDKRVPVDDVEEFINKIEQVSGKNIKGIICTTKGFQAGCINVAKYYKIALVKLLPSNEIIWDLYRTPKTDQYNDKINEKICNTLINESINIPEGFFAGHYNNKFTYSIYKLFKEFINNDYSNYSYPPIYINNKKNKIPYISTEKITEIVKNEFNKKGIKRNGEKYYFSFNEFIESILKDIKIIDNCDLGVDSNNNIIIGKYLDNTIYTVDKKNFNIPRFNFTIAHEIGHFVLHSNKNWYKDFTNAFCDIDLSDFSKVNLEEEIRKIEIQANIFATELLIPDKIFNKIITKIINEENLIDKGYGLIYLDHQSVNRELLQRIMQKIKHHFKVSNTVIEIKLKKSGILKVAYKSSKDIVFDLIEKLGGVKK